MKQINYILLIVVISILLQGCSNFQTDNIETIETNLKCSDITPGSAVLGWTTEEAITETCQEACLNNLMKYSTNYECSSNGNLKCDCILSEARINEKEMQNNLDKQKVMKENAWKVKNPGKLTDTEAKYICQDVCGERYSFSNNLNHGFVECRCNGETFNIDYETKQQINQEEVKNRIQEFLESTCTYVNISVEDKIDNFIILKTNFVNSEKNNYEFEILNNLPFNVSINLTYDRFSEWYGVFDEDVKLTLDLKNNSKTIFKDSKFENNIGLPSTGDAIIKNIKYSIIYPDLTNVQVEEKVCK